MPVRDLRLSMRVVLENVRDWIQGCGGLGLLTSMVSIVIAAYIYINETLTIGRHAAR